MGWHFLYHNMRAAGEICLCYGCPFLGEWREFIIYGRKMGRTDEGDYGTVGAGCSGVIHFGKIYGVPESNVAVPSLQF